MTLKIGKDAMGKDKILTTAKEIYNKICDLKVFKSMSVELQKRVISALVLIPIVILAIYISPVIFNALVIIIAILMSFEWIELTSSDKKYNWKLWGVLYITIPSISLMWIRSMNNGNDIILWTLAVIWATDIAGLAAGKNFGGPKLAPKISPNKTWSGLMGGVVASMVIGLMSSFMFTPGNILFFIIISGFMAVIEQMGDLVESKIKRYFKVKDSGTLIPGHGGIIDRVDGMFLVAPFVLLLVILSSERFFN